MGINGSLKRRIAEAIQRQMQGRFAMGSTSMVNLMLRRCGRGSASMAALRRSAFFHRLSGKAFVSVNDSWRCSDRQMLLR
jgi:hypothetical protein